MLTVKYAEDSVAKDIYRVLDIKNECSGANFVMYDEGEPVALWRMKILFEDKPIGLVDKVVFKEGVEDGDKLFFVHAMFFKLIEGAPMTIRVSGVHKELERFGFENVDGNMEIYSKNINLHYMCGSKIR